MTYKLDILTNVNKPAKTLRNKTSYNRTSVTNIIKTNNLYLYFLTFLLFAFGKIKI